MNETTEFEGRLEADLEEAEGKLDRLRADHRNLRILLSALITELGGTYEVPNSTLIAVEDTLVVEELPARGTVLVAVRQERS